MFHLYFNDMDMCIIDQELIRENDLTIMKSPFDNGVTCQNNPVALTYSTGMFSTELDALEYAKKIYGEFHLNRNISILKQTGTGEWFIGLQEFSETVTGSGVEPTVTMTRTFHSESLFGEAGGYLNTTVTAFGLANSAKQGAISYAIPDIAKTTKPAYLAYKSYYRFFDKVGKAASIFNLGYSYKEWRNYINRGGTDNRVIMKYWIDMGIAGMSMFCWNPVFWGVQVLYYYVDIQTNGFGLDYSVPQTINNDNQ